MNKPFHITLDEPLDRFVDEQVESGRFASPQDVVEAGLRLLEEDQRKLEWLRNALIEGENSGEARLLDRQEFKRLMRKKHLP
ncbi:type II toxin-antitoxin system ParD family antitoxin [Rhizobium sp. SSA_523]|uniref:type II toxin-antitoxin system ParD family antitoxin n=1 Tax=Rhizobium sp. SSA_523 TaxID=2952477 RepID=UPI00209057FE|nr:type II toxin-antitoxin system ParD family antitoxin [Rhizobium sp. SSA_523]MCO5731100.1 type II toxin-antitoxin system ParD family antitoxin [Rhizobium sp. SSA_523]WKC24100.1 type II toxin-antitoxin system ParD family antitoxin [Rhizobium sp. SSA_523]